MYMLWDLILFHHPFSSCVCNSDFIQPSNKLVKATFFLFVVFQDFFQKKLGLETTNINLFFPITENLDGQS